MKLLRLESCVPLVLIKPGLTKQPATTPERHWLIVTEPEDVERAITEALHRYGGLNLAVTLGKEKESPSCVVDIDGKAGMEKARDLDVSSRSDVWVTRTGSGNFHVYYYAGDMELPQRVVRAGDLPLDLLTNGYALCHHRSRWGLTHG